MTRGEVQTHEVPTPYGPGRLQLLMSESPGAGHTLVLLSHGAGNGVDSPDLAALAVHLPSVGVSVGLFDQPWRVAGRKIATAPPTLDVGLRAAAAMLPPTDRLIVGGRSAGARSAARCARDLGAVGCLALSFPLHPPGRPEKSRVGELVGAGVPTLVVQGERDAMGRPDEFPSDVPDLELSVIPGADHGFKVPAHAKRTPAQTDQLVVAIVADWILSRQKASYLR